MQVELREEALPAPGADEVLVETVCSAISAGSEMLVYRGQFPNFADTHDKFSSDLNYPTPYGYACVGKVKDLGSRADKSWRDKLVFGFQPHTSHFIVQTSSLIPAPASFSAETCSFLPNMETAVNLVQDAAPILGERVLILGQGVVGLLVASLLKEFPLDTLVTSDCYAIRRKASMDIGVKYSFDPNSRPEQGNKNMIQDLNGSKTVSTHHFAYAQNFDLAFELSGSPSALNDAIEMTRFSGRVVIGSWYGDKKMPIDLGNTFHRSRIRLISSQVSTIDPALSGRWNKARRFEVAWDALGRIQPQKWITHRFPIEKAAEAYALLEKEPQNAIQVLFDYGS